MIDESVMLSSADHKTRWCGQGTIIQELERVQRKREGAAAWKGMDVVRENGTEGEGASEEAMRSCGLGEKGRVERVFVAGGVRTFNF